LDLMKVISGLGDILALFSQQSLEDPIIPEYDWVRVGSKAYGRHLGAWYQNRHDVSKFLGYHGV